MKAANLTLREYYASFSTRKNYEARVTVARPYKFILAAYSAVSMDVARSQAIDEAADRGYDITQEFKI